MSDRSQNLSDDTLSKVEFSRRGFVKKLTAGTAFTVPLIASYSMDGLRVRTAEAAQASNFTNPGSAVREHLDRGGSPRDIIELLQKLLGIPKGRRD